MMKESPAEFDLLMSYKKGDKSALAKLYSVLGARLQLYFRGLCGRQSEAEDLLHDLFVQIHLKTAQILKSENPKAYIFQMARNLALKNSNRQNRIATQGEINDIPFLPQSGGGFFSNEAGIRKLWSALSELELDFREPILLHCWQNMSFREMESLTGISNKTLFSRYQSALAKLKKILDDRLQDEELS